MRSAAAIAALLALSACKSKPPCEGLFQTWVQAAGGGSAEAQRGWFLDRCQKADPRVVTCRDQLLAGAGSGSPRIALAWGMPGCVQKYRTLRARDEHVAGAVMAAVRAGTLAPGMALLPPDLESASLDGSVWIHALPDGRTWLFFPTWRGRDRNVAGYLWSSGPFVPADARHGTPPTMALPGFCFDDKCTQQAGEPEPFSIEKQLDPHWRFVRWAWD